MPVLGGSPLGLIGVRSRPNTTTGLSTFPEDGASIGVNKYNQSNYEYSVVVQENTASGNSTNDNTDKIKTDYVQGPKSKSSISIFSIKRRPTRFTPWPGIDKEKWEEIDLKTTPLKPANGRLHSDELYDTSIVNILQKLAGTKGQLKSTHFAYLKNVGVYPNNRLMIARRFQGAASGVMNLGYKGGPPLSVLVSWVNPGDDFFSIDFGEEWEEAEADFTNLLNDLGNDFLRGSGLGTKLGGGAGAVPLPGFTEFLQRKFMEKLGVLGEGASSFIPAGEPNLIKQAKRRKTVGYSTAGSGLKCNFQIKMVCEYEQKFISGLDPTIVWLDIVQNILRFGTSPSVFYGLSAGIMGKIMAFVNNPMAAIQRAISGLLEAINSFKNKVYEAMYKFFKELGPKPENPQPAGPSSPSGPDPDVEKQKKEIKDKIDTMFQGLVGGANQLLKNIVGKYKVRLQGILAALSGGPSGPYHVTIGNPLRPIFSCGDLIVSDTVKLTFGPILSFNDLPSTIRAEFTLVPARPLGMQEIMARFNGGHLRSVLPFPSQEERDSIATQLRIGQQEDKSTGDPNSDATKKYNEELDKQLEKFGFPPPGPESGPEPPETDTANTGVYRAEKPVTNNNTNSNISNQTDQTNATGNSGTGGAGTGGAGTGGAGTGGAGTGGAGTGGAGTGGDAGTGGNGGLTGNQNNNNQNQYGPFNQNEAINSNANGSTFENGFPERPQ